MELSCNNLINFFNNEDKIEEYTITNLKFNETENLNKIKIFNSIFDDYVLRYGIKQYYKKKNISFLYSLLFLIDKDYFTLTENEQMQYIIALKKKIRNEVTVKNLLKNLKLTGNGWNKKNLINLFETDEINNNYIYYISSYFNINIFVLNIEEKCIYPFYNDDNYNKYKTNIIVSYLNDIYEPIIYKDGSHHFLYNCHILNNILNTDKLIMPEIGFIKKNKIKEFIINYETIEENFVSENSNLPVYKINKNDIEIEEKNSISEDYNTEYKHENKYKDFTIDELLKGNSKLDLINICKELKIPYSNKNKKELAENIIKK